MDKNEFSVEIEKFVMTTGSSYIDAVLHIIDKKGLEVESGAKMISKIIKEKIETEASEANLLKEKICTLPL